MIEEQELRNLTLKAAEKCLKSKDPGEYLVLWVQFRAFFHVLNPSSKDIKETPIEELLLKEKVYV